MQIAQARKLFEGSVGTAVGEGWESFDCNELSVYVSVIFSLEMSVRKSR